MEEKWRLGEGLSAEDNMLDGITFADVILAVHHNCREITPEAIRKEVFDFVEMRLDDMKYLMEKNLDVIAMEAMKGRC